MYLLLKGIIITIEGFVMPIGDPRDRFYYPTLILNHVRFLKPHIYTIGAMINTRIRSNSSISHRAVCLEGWGAGGLNSLYCPNRRTGLQSFILF